MMLSADTQPGTAEKQLKSWSGVRKTQHQWALKTYWGGNKEWGCTTEGGVCPKRSFCFSSSPDEKTSVHLLRDTEPSCSLVSALKRFQITWRRPWCTRTNNLRWQKRTAEKSCFLLAAFGSLIWKRCSVAFWWVDRQNPGYLETLLSWAEGTYRKMDVFRTKPAFLPCLWPALLATQFEILRNNTNNVPATTLNWSMHVQINPHDENVFRYKVIKCLNITVITHKVWFSSGSWLLGCLLDCWAGGWETQRTSSSITSTQQNHQCEHWGFKVNSRTVSKCLC